VEPVGGLGAEWQVPGGRGGGVLLLEVKSTEDLRVARDELVALVQLLSADDADEAADMVDAAGSSHYQLAGRDRLHASATAHPVQPAVVAAHNRNLLLHATAINQPRVQHVAVAEWLVRRLTAVAFIATAAAIYSLGHGLRIFTAVPRSTQPSTLRGMVK